MADSRKSKSKIPARYNDCVTGNELDYLIDEDDTQDAHENSWIVDDQLDSEPLITHCQIDGKTNNVSFKTSNVSGWKETILEHFGASLAASLKDEK